MKTTTLIAALALLTGCTTYEYGPVRVSTFLTKSSVETIKFTTLTNGMALEVTGYRKDEVTGPEAIAAAAAEGAARGALGGGAP